MLKMCMGLKNSFLVKCMVFLLLAAIFFSSSVFSSNAQTASSFSVDGYVFNIISQDFDGVQISYNEDGKECLFYLDKANEDGKAEVDICVETNEKTRSATNDMYILEFDENVEYASDSLDVSSATLVDNTTGEEYSLNENARVAFVIPLGIPLLAAAIEALLAVGSAIIIAGVAYTIVEEVATALRNQNTYRYYRAVLRNGAVYVGGALEYTLAYTLARSDDSKGTVLATSFSYAKGLASNNYRGPENHGSGSGYWDHIHAKSGTTAYKAHIWYL